MIRFPGSLVESEQVADDVRIGFGCVVGPAVVLHSRVVLHSHVVLTGAVELGPDTEVFPGAVIGKAAARHPTLLRPARPTGPVRVGSGCSIGTYAVIYDDVEIGEGSLVGDGASLREGTRVGRDSIVGRSVSTHPEVRIGDHSRVLDHTHLASRTVVGHRCFIGVHVVTSSDNDLGRLAYDHERVQGPVIGDDVRIGSGSVLLPAVRIGSGATLGAGAVVTRNVESGSTVFGVPAKPAASGGGTTPITSAQ